MIFVANATDNVCGETKTQCVLKMLIATFGPFIFLKILPLEILIAFGNEYLKCGNFILNANFFHSGGNLHIFCAKLYILCREFLFAVGEKWTNITYTMEKPSE